MTMEPLDAEVLVEDTEEDFEADLLNQAIEDFRLCQDREQDNRREYIDDVRFARLGEQWDEDLKAQRLQEGRPCLTINKLPTFIRQVVNDARQNKPQIKVSPQDSLADPATADIYSGLIRNIETSSDADVAYDTALECAASGGFGYFRINLAYAHDETWDQDIVFEPVPDPLRVYGDPYSDAADSADWDVAFVTEMVPKAAFKRRWPDAALVDFTSADKWPTGWRDGDQIMVAEYWTRVREERMITLLSDGEVVGVEEYEANREQFEASGVMPAGSPRPVPSYKVTQHIITATEVLQTTEWAGKFIPIVPVYGETVVLENKRHLRSLIRDAKDSQIQVNAWESAATEMVAMAPKAPWIGEQGAFDYDPNWQTANRASHPYLEVAAGKQPPVRQAFTGMPVAEMQMTLHASDNMKSTTGIYNAGLGAQGNETSGVAIDSRKRESDTGTFHYIDNLARAIRHGARIIIDLIPKVYSGGRIARILGEDGTATNVPVAGDAADLAQARQAEMEKAAEQQREVQQVYALGVGRYDLTVAAGPSYGTRREEAARQMIEAARAFPGLFEVAGDLIAKNLDWPGAEEIAERLSARMQQQAQPQQAPAEPQPPPDPAAMIKAQTEQFEAQTDAQQGAEKLRIDAFNAETARLKAVREIQKPTQAPRMPEYTG